MVVSLFQCDQRLELKVAHFSKVAQRVAKAVFYVTTEVFKKRKKLSNIRANFVREYVSDTFQK